MPLFIKSLLIIFPRNPYYLVSMSFVIGDLAITVACWLAGNNGQLIRNKSASSYEYLGDYQELQYVLGAEIETQHGWFVYE